MLQAAAAMGQSRLMHAYEQEFEAAGRETAQVLLTLEDIRSRTRYLNIRNTIFTLWSFGVVPIVNENDTVSFAEIRFGDNDIISAHLAAMLDADLLVILTDTDGLYDANPKTHRDARPIRTVERITDGVLAGAAGQGLRVLLGRHGLEDPGRRHRHAGRGGRGDREGRGPRPRRGSWPARRSARTSCLPSGACGAGRSGWPSTPAPRAPSWWTAGAERAIVGRDGRCCPRG